MTSETLYEIDGNVLAHQRDGDRHRLVLCCAPPQIAGEWVGLDRPAKVCGYSARMTGPVRVQRDTSEPQVTGVYVVSATEDGEIRQWGKGHPSLNSTTPFPVATEADLRNLETFAKEIDAPECQIRYMAELLDDGTMRYRRLYQVVPRTLDELAADIQNDYESYAEEKDKHNGKIYYRWRRGRLTVQEAWTHGEKDWTKVGVWGVCEAKKNADAAPWENGETTLAQIAKVM